jgi:hypothetical protein
MNYGSGSESCSRSVREPDFGSGYNIKMYLKSQKIENERPTSDIEKARFCAIFLFWGNCDKPLSASRA